MSKTHWKTASDSPYLGSWDLPDYKDLTLTIDNVKTEMSKGLKENDIFNIITFKEPGFKRMLLNSTNCKTIRKLTKSPYLEDWGGTRITLFVTQVNAFGDMHDALRIRPVTKLEVKPEMNPSHKKWVEIQKKVQDEGVTLEQIQKHYSITETNFKKLQENGTKKS
jgi:hypothetical protein